MTAHFAQRVEERLPCVCSSLLWFGVERAIQEGRSDLVEYCGRQEGGEKRVFRFRSAETGEFFRIVTNDDATIPITVFKETAA